MMFRSSLIALLSSLVLTSFGAVAQTPEAVPQLRLPDRVTPTSYQVELQLDPQAEDFTGQVAIHLDVKQPVQTIWLNATSIQVTQAKLESPGASALTPKVIAGGTDFVGFGFDSPLKTGQATLTIQYKGKVRLQDSSGVFRMLDKGNKYIFTQFEQTDARAAFPCFDEPSYKVPWQLTLSIPQDQDAVSNTPIEHQSTTDGRKVLAFKQTKPLPSYLVAFAVGQFDFVPAGTAGRNHVPVRIVTPKGHAAEAKYAAEVTATILTRLEEYFDIPYPYEKSDQVAIPVTYGFGAMENAGMVTYSQDLLLGSADRDSVSRQRSYASVAAHELSHQWFGDLVTTAWWNDIWLNEAFATWMEQHLLAQWKPEWQTRLADVDSKLGAETEDTLLSARKIRQEIKSKDDISNAFDGITYQKGAAVIGMFESWVGSEPFRKGVQNYLRQYAFRNATAGDFLQSVSRTIGKDISGPFSTFLNQPGVPLVSVSLDCSQGTAQLRLSQTRSLPLGSKDDTKQQWQIPVCVRYSSGGGNQNACTLMSDPQTSWTLKGSGCPAWVEANANAVGYYRVNYQGNLFTALTEGDVAQRLSGPERVDLLGNSQALSITGKLPVADALKLVDKFNTDTSRYVVERALNIALEPRTHMVPQNLEANYQRFLLREFQARARELGWTPKPGEPDDVRLLRPPLLRAVSTYAGDQQLADEARKLTEKWFADHSSLDPNLTAPVLETAAYYGDKALFDRFMNALAQTQDRLERRRILSALGSFRDPGALHAGMEAVLTGKVPFIEGLSLLFAGQGNRATQHMAFDFMKDHFDQLAKARPTGGGSDSGAVFSFVGASFCDAQSYQQLKDFFTPHIDQFVGAPRQLAQILESVQACVARKDKNEQSVSEFLQGF